jgi:hypothetical protein
VTNVAAAGRTVRGATRIVRRFGVTVVGPPGDARRLRHHRVHRIGPLPASYAAAVRAHPAPFVVPLERTTTPCGFSYAEGGWHPYAVALAEHLDDPERPYEGSVLHRYYECFRPMSVQEALLGPGPPLPPIDTWPPVPKLYKHLWTLTPRRVRSTIAASEGWRSNIKQHLGPQPRAQARDHLARIQAVYDSVCRDGYRPETYRDGVVTGYFLERDGQVRFMVVLGNHRLAAFHAAGVREVVARIHPGHPPVINRDRLETWSRRSGQVVPTAVAERVFDELFTETGARKAARLGLR